MTEINSHLIEKYQLLLTKEPNSKVFAPLAEAYRRLGLLEEARKVCEQGIHSHPDFASGRVAYARVLFDLEQYEKTLAQLLLAVDLSPENLLANSLLADTYLHLKRPKDALKAFKMVLLLNPNNSRAKEAVRKLESLTADEYDDELFEMKSLGKLKPTEASQVTKNPTSTIAPHSLLERYLSLADAYIVRNEIEKALQTLKNAEQDCGTHHEIDKRILLLSQRAATPMEPMPEPLEPIVNSEEKKRNKKVDLLKRLLDNIENQKKETS